MPDKWDSESGRTHFYGDGCPEHPKEAEQPAAPAPPENDEPVGKCDFCDAPCIGSSSCGYTPRAVRACAEHMMAANDWAQSGCQTLPTAPAPPPAGERPFDLLDAIETTRITAHEACMVERDRLMEQTCEMPDGPCTSICELLHESIDRLAELAHQSARPVDIEQLGRAVRTAWVARAAQKHHDRAYVAWEQLDEFERETDRQIARAVLSAAGAPDAAAIRSLVLRIFFEDGRMTASDPLVLRVLEAVTGKAGGAP